MTDDDMANALLATGALWQLLNDVIHDGLIDEHNQGIASVHFPNDRAGNQIDVTFTFLASPYRITVERVKDDDQS